MVKIQTGSIKYKREDYLLFFGFKNHEIILMPKNKT